MAGSDTATELPPTLQIYEPAPSVLKFTHYKKACIDR